MQVSYDLQIGVSPMLQYTCHKGSTKYLGRRWSKEGSAVWFSCLSFRGDDRLRLPSEDCSHRGCHTLLYNLFQDVFPSPQGTESPVNTYILLSL